MIRLLALFTLAISACSSQRTPQASISPQNLATPLSHPQAVYANPETAITKLPTTQTLKPKHPTQVKIPLAYHHTSRNGIIMSLVSFDDRDFQLQVADQANGPGSRWRDAHSAANAMRGVAAINGGFFTPEGKPLGLVISKGTRRGYVNQSSLGAGIYLSSGDENTLLRRKSYTQSPNQWGTITHLLQSGPMLAENKKSILGLSKKSNRPRSFIAWDGQHHWAIGYAESCTLDALSRALAGKAPADFPIHSAINLDGGRSSDLWAGSKVAGGNKIHRGFFNKPVRNFLVIVPK